MSLEFDIGPIPSALDKPLRQDFMKTYRQEKAARQAAASPQAEQPQVEPELESQTEQPDSQTLPEPDVDADGARSDAAADAAHLEPGAAEHVGEHGGSGGQPAQSEQSVVASQPEQVDPAAQEQEASITEAAAADAVMTAAPPQEVALDSEHKTPVPLQKSDHQDAVQNAARAGSSSSSSASKKLPRSGFKLWHSTSEPGVRGMPEAVMDQMRELLASAAVRELAVSGHEARAFAGKLSQTSLVVAFLCARLDHRLEVDEATNLAATLFRSQDPLMGGVLARLEALEASDQQIAGTMTKVAGEVKAVHEATTALEHGVAFYIADRVANLNRGATGLVEDIPVGDKRVVVLRDKLRSAAAKQTRAERDRDGRRY